MADLLSSYELSGGICPLGRKKYQTCLTNISSLEQADNAMYSASAEEVAKQRWVRECQCTAAPPYMISSPDTDVLVHLRWRN